jgi:hypothetical protein
MEVDEEEEEDHRGDNTVVWMSRDDSCESSNRRMASYAHSLAHGRPTSLSSSRGEILELGVTVWSIPDAHC